MRQIGPDEKTDCFLCHGIGLFPTGPGQREGSRPVAHFLMLACPCSGEFGPNGIRGGNAHQLTLADVNGWVAWVDGGIREDVEALWRAGIQTWVSCEGEKNTAGWGRYLSLLRPSAEQISVAREMLPWAVSEEAIGTKEHPNGYNTGWSYVFRGA